MSECTQERFMRDIANHTMTVLMDNGVYRHIKFSNGGSSIYRFDLITWPGTLCIDGDCGTWVFSRLHDMFEFFRREEKYQPEKLSINRGYWAEKLDAVSRRDKVKEWSPKIFRERVLEYFYDHFESSDYELEQSEIDAKRESCLSAIERDVLYYEDDEIIAQQSINDFEHEGFRFHDAWEWDFTEYTFSFIWNLYAIAYGIREYDKVKAIA